MVDNIDMSNGRANFAHSGAKAWHGKGLFVNGNMDIKSALVAGNLDWLVDKKEMTVEGSIGVDADGNITEMPNLTVPGYRATVRRDTNQVLGIVGADYEVVQNLEALEPFEALFGKDTACLETVGSLADGNRIFAMARMPETMEILPGDPVERFLLITTSHDGTNALKVIQSNLRTVCQNTLNANLRGAKGCISIKHTKNVKLGMAKIKEMLAASDSYWQEATACYKHLASQQMNEESVKDFLRKLFPGKKLLEDEPEEVATRTQNMRDRILTLYDGQAIGSDLAGKTKWQAFNSVCHFIDWEREGRERKSGVNPGRWEDSVFGLGQNLRQTALDLLLV